MKNGSVTLPSEEWLIDTYKQTISYLEQKSLLQYEISNFAKPGFASIHNKAYWDRRPYQGFGLSAASFDGKKRLVNSNNLVEYLNHQRSKGGTSEILTQENIIMEEMMLGLRQKKGVDLQRMIYLLQKQSFDRKLTLERNVEKIKKSEFN